MNLKNILFAITLSLFFANISMADTGAASGDVAARVEVQLAPVKTETAKKDTSKKVNLKGEDEEEAADGATDTIGIENANTPGKGEKEFKAVLGCEKARDEKACMAGVEFQYGITDRLGVVLSAEASRTRTEEGSARDARPSIGLKYRAIDVEGLKVAIAATYTGKGSADSEEGRTVNIPVIVQYDAKGIAKVTFGVVRGLDLDYHGNNSKGAFAAVSRNFSSTMSAGAGVSVDKTASGETTTAYKVGLAKVLVKSDKVTVSLLTSIAREITRNAGERTSGNRLGFSIVAEN